MININSEDFGILCICAIRYCQGRETYMPSLVQRIVKGQIKHVSDKQLTTMINDCDYQKRYNLYGDERIDKPSWLEWEKFLKDEKERRRKE